MHRIRTYVRRRFAGDSTHEEHSAYVQQVLVALNAREILGIAREGTHVQLAQGLDMESHRGESSIAMLEAGQLSADSSRTHREDPILSQSALAEAFLQKAVQVHPASNSDQRALLAFRWCADAFKELRSESSGNPPQVAVPDDQSHPSRSQDIEAIPSIDLPAAERECLTDAGEALHLFAEATQCINDHLSLQPAPGTDEPVGVTAQTADALLRALHILHLRTPFENVVDNEDVEIERSMLDSVLYAALSTHWMLRMITRVFFLGSRRHSAERYVNTLIAAVGGVVFTGVCRINRMVSSNPENVLTRTARDDAALGVIEMFIQCPLCRETVPTSRAIRNVHAGEAVPSCCVCTENRSDVCLPCGHLCLCQACFSQMPRTTAP